MKKSLFLLSLFLLFLSVCAVRIGRGMPRAVQDIYSLYGRSAESTADFSGWPIYTYRPVRMPNGEEHYFLIQPDHGDEITWIAAQRAHACERAAESKAQRFFCDALAGDLLHHGWTVKFITEYSELLKQEAREAKDRRIFEAQEATAEWIKTAPPNAIPPNFFGDMMNFETLHNVWEVPSTLPLEKAGKDTPRVEAEEDAHPRESVPVTGGVRFADTKMYRWRERMQETIGVDLGGY